MKTEKRTPQQTFRKALLDSMSGGGLYVDPTPRVRLQDDKTSLRSDWIKIGIDLANALHKAKQAA